ncbi:MAG: putative lipid II flippase FtsW, partial [Acidimicrobiales bacterium]
RPPALPTPKPPSGRRSAVFLLLLLVVVGLNLIGLVMVLSASSVNGLHHHDSSWYHFKRQAVWSALGGVSLLLTLRVDYHRWRRFAGPGLLASLGALLLVLTPGLGVEVNGASRWLGVGPLQFQPSELAKLAVLVFVADLLARRLDRMRDTQATLRPVMVVSGAVAALLMLQPNLGTTIIVGAIVLVLLFVAGAPLGRLSALAGGGFVAATALALSASYRRARVLAFLHPNDDPTDTGYQTLQSWLAIASGRLTGVGIGASRAKWGFLPFAHTDFIFAIIAEEFGLVGAGFVVLLFVAIGVLGALTALRAPDPFGMLLASGITAWLLVQAFVNIGAVVGILPITGVPLPFVSFGGSSLCVGMGAVGILLNIARQARWRTPTPTMACAER